jgi:4-amino-4-deoxy-L-arabinose transferase-like glycosyltransferase
MTLTETPVPPDGNTSAGPGAHSAPGYLSYVDDRPDWVARGSLLALLVAVAFLYIWGLSESGYANPFYSAAAQAGSENWTAWFFGSLDGGNSITVDKPPAAIWLMALSVRLFGLSSWSILVPEALLGVASVGVLYASVRRSLLRWRDQGTHPLTARGAHWAAIAGAVVFALTPVATLMFRFNNPDALLVFTMVLASYFTVRASEQAGRKWLIFAGVAIGFGFLTKMMQAFLVLPALVVAYWFAAPATWKKKVVDLLAALVAVVVSAGWYLAVVELTPSSLRPYIGGSDSNSILELILSYNGLGRLTGDENGSVGSQWGTTSILRMFEGTSGGMVSWLIPAALVLAGGAIFVAIRSWRKQLPNRRARVQSPAQALLGGATIWLGWLVVTALVFSFMAGIYHDYYTVALAPAIGGAVAIGGAALWANRGHALARIALAVTSIGTGIWALVLLMQAGSWYTWLGWGVFAAATIGGLAMIWVDKMAKFVAAAVLAVVLGAGLAGPLAYSINTAATAHTGSIVTAGPVSSMGTGGMGGGTGGGQPPTQDGQTTTQTGTTTTTTQSTGQPPSQTGTTSEAQTSTGVGALLNGATASTELVAALQASGSSYTWVVATVGAQNAATYQLASGYSAMAIGGFNGTDPSPTLAQFKTYVSEGKIHYFIAGGTGSSDSSTASEITTWVEANFTSTTIGGTTVYDLTSQN